MSSITDFPLIWRWTSAAHAMFSASELASLHPFTSAEAARIHDDSRGFALSTGIDPQRFSKVRIQSADISTAEGCSWLRAEVPNLVGEVMVSWDRETALRTSWEFFTAHWDDFCYPVSDDVLVLPYKGNWVLLYQHVEIFHLGSVNTPA